MKQSRWGWFTRALLAGATLAVCASGCSAIVNPDEGRLGGDRDGGADMDAAGSDAGDGDRDAGPRDDAARDDAGDGCPPSCDDSVACTEDRCEDGRCVNEPDDDECEDDERCNPVMGCVPQRCENDGQCDDGMFCNGTERCTPGGPGTGCVSGDAVVCNDMASCTDDSCDEDTDSCAFEPVHERCVDAQDCTLNICNPAASTADSGCVNPPDNSACATEFCTLDRVCDPVQGCVGGNPRNCADTDPCTIESCDEMADRCDSARLDADMDMFPAATAIGPGGTLVMCGGNDCDDSDPMVNPGVMEVCGDLIDNNCNAMVDEGCAADTCASAQEVVLDAVGRGTATGSFASLTHNYQTGTVCGAGMNGRDAVYYIDLPPGLWDVTIDTVGSVADTVLGLGFVCSNLGFQTACNDDQNAGLIRTSRIWLHQVGQAAATTRVFILVDAFSASETGAYTLNVERRSPLRDSCLMTGGPFDLTGGGTLLGQTVRGTDFYSGSCTPGGTRTEGIFYVSGSGSSRFDVYSTAFNPSIYLRRDNCRTGTQLGCANGSAIGGGVNQATLTRTLSSGTDYYFFVDNAQDNQSYAIYYEP